MSAHDVVGFVNGLSEKLASRSRHVCLFLGAGASKACGLPDVAGLTQHVRGSLTDDQLAAFERLATGRNLEQVLSRLRRIATLLEKPEDTVDGLTGEQAGALDIEICRIIIESLVWPERFGRLRVKGLPPLVGLNIRSTSHLFRSRRG